MTVFTRTWNASYEASPANSNPATQGAQRIREFKIDVRERLEVDHVYGNASTEEGYHKFAHLKEQSADPSAMADFGVIYSKQVGSITELFYRDSSGNIIQLTNAGSANAFPTGTKMLFQQTAAPTGWTKDTTHNDKAIRVVSGSVGSGGASAFTTVFGASKNTGSESSHTHSGTTANNSNFLKATTENVTDYAVGAHNHTFTTGAGTAHSHTLSLDLQYMDVIVATKN